jgi:hypothetical protein
MEIGTPGYCGALPVLGQTQMPPSLLTMLTRGHGVIQAVLHADIMFNIVCRKLKCMFWSGLRNIDRQASSVPFV